MKHLVSFLVIIFLLFTSQPAHAFFGKAIYKVTVKVFSTEVGEEILYFFGSKALRKGIKNIECLNGEWKLVLKDKAFVYEQPDLSSDVRVFCNHGNSLNKFRTLGKKFPGVFLLSLSQI